MSQGQNRPAGVPDCRHQIPEALSEICQAQTDFRDLVYENCPVLITRAFVHLG